MPTLTEAAAFFLAAAGRCPEVMAGVVAGVVTVGAERAKGLIGHEHDGWPELSTATTEGFYHQVAHSWIPGKIELGYGGAESPLKRTGALQDSIGAIAVGLRGEVGSDSNVALWQEMGAISPFGYKPIPPRPFISRGLMEAAETAFPELMRVAVLSLLVP